MSFVVSPPPVPFLPVVGGAPGACFPIHRVYCVGRNYVNHAIEMGGSGREAPFFFMKPADAVLPVSTGQTGKMHYPSLTRELHHEVELVVALGKGGHEIRAQDALSHVWGYAVGLDVTRRDLQSEAKQLGRPKCTGKAFDESAPISSVRPAEQCYVNAATQISLEVNGASRQHSVLGKLIWSVAEIIEKLSAAWALQPGDLIFTGTPEGVGPVIAGDVLRARIDGVGELNLEIVAR